MEAFYELLFDPGRKSVELTLLCVVTLIGPTNPATNIDFTTGGDGEKD